MTGETGRVGGGTPRTDGSVSLAAGREAVEEQRAAVRRMFDRVSRRYDLLNRLLSFGLDLRWRRDAVRAMKLGAGDWVLDVACGTGDLGIETAGAVPQGGVVGVDFSAPMLRIARRKAGRGAGERLSVAAGAAESLPVGTDRFGAAGIAFGIRNVPDRAAALGEIARAVRPGGRVVVLEFTASGKGAIDRLAGWYLRHVLPRVGGLFSSTAAYRYLTASIGSFPSPEEFAGEMEEAGLTGVCFRHLAPGPTWLFSGTVSGGRPLSPSPSRW